MITTDDIRRGHEVLGHLMTVNVGMGRALLRMNDYEAVHGQLPVRELRQLAGLLAEIAVEIGDYADRLVQPDRGFGEGSAVVAAGVKGRTDSDTGRDCDGR